MYKYPNGRILIFAKAPVAGEVKTRLQTILTADQCAHLQRKLIERTLDTAINSDICPIELWCSVNTTHPFFSQCRDRYAIPLASQHGDNLGERMFTALQQTLQSADFAIVIGCDCVALNATHLEQAGDSLAQQHYSVVLAPAEDGGYALIGARQADQQLFNNVDWGTDTVLESTRQNLAAMDCQWHELATLWDIDRPSDLQRLRKRNHFGLDLSDL